MCSTDTFLAILAFLFPPLPVWVKRGICSADSLINLALCCLGWLPGLLHAWYIISKYPDPYDLVYERIPADDPRSPPGATNGAVVYYTSGHAPQQHHCCAPGRIASGQPSPAPQLHAQHPHPPSHPQYNTFNDQNQAPQRQPGERSPERYTQFRQQVDLEAGEGSTNPPSYADVVKADHKVQTHE